MEVKNVIFAHGKTPEVTFAPKTIDELIGHGLDKDEIVIPNFPTKIGKQNVFYDHGWTKVFDELEQNGYLNKNAVLVAHSLGNVASLKYISENDIKLGKFVSVAGADFANDANKGIYRFLLKTLGFKLNETNFEKANQLAGSRHAVFSKGGDSYASEEAYKNFANKLNADKLTLPERYEHLNAKAGNGGKVCPYLANIILDIPLRDK